MDLGESEINLLRSSNLLRPNLDSEIGVNQKSFNDFDVKSEPEIVLPTIIFCFKKWEKFTNVSSTWIVDFYANLSRTRRKQRLASSTKYYNEHFAL